MNEKPAERPGAPEGQYRTLGPKTLWMFTLERVHAAGAVFLAAALFLAFKDQPFLRTVPVVGDITRYTNAVTLALAALFVVVSLITFLVSWLVYVNYQFALGENALKIKRGIINKEEVAIPYRQIQDVDIDRDLGFQMMGLSRVVILTAGHDDEKPGNDRSEGVFPALDKDLAEWLQKELLDRANVQKVVEANAPPSTSTPPPAAQPPAN